MNVFELGTPGGHEVCSTSGRMLGGSRIWNDRSELVIERPWFNTTPLFIAIENRRARLGASWRSLGPFGDLDLIYVQDYVRYQTPFSGRTFSTNINLIRNGERWAVSENARRVARLDLPNPSDERLEEILERELISAGRDAVYHLSSGLDSSLLAMMGRRLHGRARAATFRARGPGASQELQIITRLAQDKDIDLEIHDFTEIDIWKEGIDLINDGLPYPIAHPSHLVRYLLDRCLSRQKVRTIVTGRGPDEMLGGYAAHRPEFRDATAYSQRVTCTSEAWVRRLFRDPQQSVASRAYVAAANAGKLSLQSILKSDLHGIFEAWNIVESGLSRALSVKYINPFLAPEAAAHMFARPERDKILNGEQKVLLRRRFSDIYPDYILQQQKIGLTLDIGSYLEQDTVASIVRRLYEDSEFGQKFLRRDGLVALVDDTLSRQSNYGWQIWSLYLCHLAYSTLFSK